MRARGRHTAARLPPSGPDGQTEKRTRMPRQGHQRGVLAHPVLGHGAWRPAWRRASARRSRSIVASWISSKSIISSATEIRSRASTGRSRPARNCRPASVCRSSGAPAIPWCSASRGSAGPNSCARRPACSATARLSAIAAHARAAPTTPAADPGTTTTAAMSRQRDRSWRGASGPAAHWSPPARPGARPRRSAQVSAHEQPARARLHGDMNHPAGEPGDPLLDRCRRGLICPLDTSLVAVSSASTVICCRCTSNSHGRSRPVAYHKRRACDRAGVTPARRHTVTQRWVLLLRTSRSGCDCVVCR